MEARWTDPLVSVEILGHVWVPDVDEAVQKVLDWYGEEATAVVEVLSTQRWATHVLFELPKVATSSWRTKLGLTTCSLVSCAH